MHSHQISSFAPVIPALLTHQNNPIILDAQNSHLQSQVESLIRSYDRQLTPGQNIVMATVHNSFIYPNQKIILKNIPLSFPADEIPKEVNFPHRIISDNSTWYGEGSVSITSGTLTVVDSKEEISSKKIKISLTANACAIGLTHNISVIQKHPEAICKKAVLIDGAKELIEAPTISYDTWQKTQTGHLTGKVKTVSTLGSVLQGTRGAPPNTAHKTNTLLDKSSNNKSALSSNESNDANANKPFNVSRKREEASLKKNKAIVSATLSVPPTPATSSNASNSSTTFISNAKQSTNSSSGTKQYVGESSNKASSNTKPWKHDALNTQKFNISRQGIGNKTFVEYDKIKKIKALVNQATSVTQNNEDTINYVLENNNDFDEKTFDKALTLALNDPRFVSVVEQSNVEQSNISPGDINLGGIASNKL